MNFRKLAFVCVAFFGIASTVTVAHAQNKVFVIDEAAIRDGSKIGADIRSKLGAIEKEGVEKLGLQALSEQVQTEQERLQPQLQTIVGEDGRIKSESLNANPTLKSQVEALGQKQTELAQKSNVLQQNLNQQTNAALTMFNAALGPAVDYVAQQEGADVVLSSSSTWYAGNRADLSQKVIARLDATTPTLESLEAALKAQQQ